MAKSRVTVNDDEQQMVQRARELSKLRAKRRGLADDLAALDKEIEGVAQELSRLTQPVVPVAPAGS